VMNLAVDGRWWCGVAGRMIAAAVLLAIWGCDGPAGASSEFFSLTPYQTQVRQVFQADEPVALLTFDARDTANRRGEMLGMVHGWPFPHTDPSGEFGEGLFSYRTALVLRPTSAGANDVRETASGMRSLYYHGGEMALSFDQPDGFSAGEAVTKDAVDLDLTFSPDRQRVDVTMLTRQVDTKPFIYKGQNVMPPNRQDEKLTMSGYFSPSYGGYLLR